MTQHPSAAQAIFRSPRIPMKRATTKPRRLTRKLPTFGAVCILLSALALFLAIMGKKPNKTSSTEPGTITSPSTFLDGGALPKLFVFDLDYTLWPFWVDTHVTPPIKASPEHDHCKDRYGDTFKFYDDTPAILHSLRAKGIKVGAASRTSAPDLGREMLRLLHIPDVDGNRHKAVEYFDHLEIYPGSKITHFNRLQQATKLRYEDMLFFDDESRNRNVETLGVTMHLVRDGVSTQEIDNGVEAWRKRHGHSAGPSSSG